MLKISKNFKTIVGKIYIGYGIMIVAFILNIILTSIIVIKNRERAKEFSSIIDPSLFALNEQKFLELKSQMLISLWLPSSQSPEKVAELNDVLEVKFPKVKDELEHLARNWHSEADINKLDSILMLSMTNNIDIKNIMQMLQTFEDYNDPEKKFTTQDIFESSIVPNVVLINTEIEKIIKLLEIEKAEINAEIENVENNFIITIVISSLILVTIGFLFSYLIGNSIRNKLSEFKTAISDLCLGKLKQIKLTITTDEIGLMSSTLTSYVESIKETTVFATKIGVGNFGTDFKPLSDDDELGKSLLSMRDNLKMLKEEQEQRNWISAGMAKFSEILRDTTRSTDEICETMLSQLAKYTNSVQGNIYLLKNDEQTKENYFNLTSFFAFDRKKFHNKRIEMGQGLVGQCYYDNDKIFLTEVPQEYITITSGLGDAPPTCILLVPIRQNNLINGVLELTTFYPYKPYVIEFIERIGEIMGAAIATVQINENTRKLLEESQQHSEELRAQEEEMRQNMEELQATQEEINRKSVDIEKIIAAEKKIFSEKENNMQQKIEQLETSNKELIDQILKISSN